MKNKFSLILFSILLSTTFAWAQTTTSAYYEVPAGAFFAGMTDNSSAADKTFYLPYNLGQEYTFTSTEAGTWTSEGGAADETNKNYSYKSCEMKGSYHIPFLTVGETGYQYGSSGESYDGNLLFHIGNSEMHNMTPARLYGADGKQTNYLRSEYNMSTHSTIGVYFDNKDVMYIDGISIPVKNSTAGATETSLFPANSKITINIYEASGIAARTDNQGKRSKSPKKSIVLNSGNYKKYSDTETQRGALNATFTEDPLIISGSFVVEIINTGCKFTVYSSTEIENKWGYYIDNNEEKYPATYTPLISVHAMFPVLYGEANESLDVTVPSTGPKMTDSKCPTRTVYANCKYETDKNGWSRKASQTGVITMNFKTAEQTDDYTKWYFVMGENQTEKERKVDVTFNFRGKELTYHVTQAPKISSISILDSESKQISALSLKATETATLTASLFPETTDQMEITWSSSNDGIATVTKDTETGEVVVTAVAPGTAIITATSKANSEITATCEVTVTPKVEALNVPTSNLIAPSAGGDVKFTKNGTDYSQIEYTITGKDFVDEDWDVTFSDGCDWVEYYFDPDQENPNRAIITLKANKENKTGGNLNATVTIEAYGYTFYYPIIQAPMINQIVGFSDNIPLKKGDETNLTATVLPDATDQDKTVNWSSSDTKIATVTKDTEKGKVIVKAVAPGTAIITATSVANEKIKKTCTVTVYEVTKKDPTTTTLTAQPAGGDTEVKFTLSGAEFNTANWSVSEKPDWISVNETAFTSENTTVTCTLTADKNATGSKRDGTIKIKAFADEFSYTITQESMPSAFYELPTGAFFAGMTDNGGNAEKTFYLPYEFGQEYTFTSTEAGTWTSDGGDADESNKNYSYSNRTMKDSCHTPLLAVDGKVGYQYGASGESYDANLYFHIGDSVMHNMTPARLYGDQGKSARMILGSYKSEEHDAFGLCFNNTDVMYIDGISIPITSNKSGETDENLFPENNSHVKVTIYHAKITDQGYSFDRTDQNTIWDSTLTKEAFKKYSDKEGYRGALNATFKPIPIEGQFVIELREMNTSGCKFYIYVAPVKDGNSKWGYYVDKSTRYISTYTPAISVHAMFPAMYPEAYTDTVIYIPAEGTSISKGNRPIRTIYANVKYDTKGKDGWDFSTTQQTGYGISVANNYKTESYTPWYFTMGENTTTAEREGYVTFTFRGKELKYHLIQVPTPYTRSGLTPGNWGTICLPYAAESFSGAEMYSIAGKMDGGDGIYLDQVDTMEAGKPYIFKATANKIEVVYAAAEPQEAQSVNGLCGYIGESDSKILQNDGNYIVYDNALYYVDSENVTIASNRAYIKYDSVPGTAPAPAPQVRRVAMPINGAPANMLQVNDTKQPVKILRDGHIVILRADKEYDILGQSK